MLKSQVNHALWGIQYPKDMQTMGERIRAQRQSRGLTQDEMGKIVGVSGATISQWESGVVTGIKPENFLRFCAYFPVDPFYIAFGPLEERNDPLERFRMGGLKGA